MQPPPLDFQGARWGLGIGKGIPGELSPGGKPLGRAVPPAREPLHLIPGSCAVGRAQSWPQTLPQTCGLSGTESSLSTADQEGALAIVGVGMPTGLSFSGAGEVVLGGVKGGSCLGDSIIHQPQHPVSGYQFQQASPDSQAWSWGWAGRGPLPSKSEAGTSWACYRSWTISALSCREEVGTRNLQRDLPSPGAGPGPPFLPNSVGSLTLHSWRWSSRALAL